VEGTQTRFGLLSQTSLFHSRAMDGTAKLLGFSTIRADGHKPGEIFLPSALAVKKHRASLCPSPLGGEKSHAGFFYPGRE
jgi:hypothetical protein